MVFKLVRVDGSEPCKIPLPVGTHIVGRGKFLDCNDMRVSRNHGILEVTEDTVILKSLHTNPCFYTKKRSNEKQLIKQDETVTLFNGDKFGLIPDQYWYELLLCHVDVFPLKSPPVMKEEKVVEQNDDENCESTEPLQSKESCVDEAKNIDSKTLDGELNVTIENAESPKSPSMLEAEEQATGVDKQPTTTVTEKQPSTSAAESNQADESTQPLPPNQCEARTPVKRSHSSPSPSQSEEVKKIKKEPDSPDDVKPGPSNDMNPSKTDGNDKSPPPTNPPAPLRERCMYGANCYRKNVQHKVQFSHPADPDWGAGARAACPWGRACRRTAARHWRDHSHPPGVHQPDHTPGMQVVERRGNVFYINAHSVNFFDDHFQVEDSDGDSVDYDYEF